MKKLFPALLVLLLVALMASCGNKGTGTTDTTAESATEGETTVTETEPATEAETTAAPETTAAVTEPETAANPPEELIDYASVSSSKKDVTSLVDINSLEWDVDGFSDKESAPNLFDGDTATKYCCSLPPTITFKLTESKKLTAYAFATANDNSQYGRSPEEYTLYGSTDGKDWKVLDYVQKASDVVQNVDLTYYAFMIDADKQGDYQYYKFEVLGVSTPDGSTTFQMSELQLFTD